MSVNSILPVAVNSLRNNARQVTDAASKIVQIPVENPVVESPSEVSSGPTARSLFDDQAFVENHDSFSDQDLLTQVMRIKKAEVAYHASASLIRTADEISKVLIEAVS